jgi:hypothetical protein
MEDDPPTGDRPVYTAKDIFVHLSHLKGWYEVVREPEKDFIRDPVRNEKRLLSLSHARHESYLDVGSKKEFSRREAYGMYLRLSRRMFTIEDWAGLNPNRIIGALRRLQTMNRTKTAEV